MKISVFDLHILIIIIVQLIAPVNAGSSTCTFNYTIEAKLIPEKNLLTGKASINYTVSSPALTDEIVIYAPSEKQTVKKYLSLSVTAYEDPIIEKISPLWFEISDLTIDGENYDISRGRREKDYIILTFNQKKKQGSRVKVTLTFTTHFLNARKNLYFAVWYPCLFPSNYKYIHSLPNSYDIRLEIPENYKLVANTKYIKKINDTACSENYALYLFKASHISEIYWIASSKLRIVRSSDKPFKWNIWSDRNNVPEKTIEAFERQLERYIKLFGMPTIIDSCYNDYKPELNLCLVPLSKYMGGGSSGELIVLNKNYFKWSFFRVAYPVISHELLHFWWTNRDHDTYTSRDVIFVEAFTDHLIDFFKEDIVVERHGKILKWVKKSTEDYTLFNYRINARSGNTKPVFPKSQIEISFDEVNLSTEPHEEKGTILLNTISKRFTREEWRKRILSYYNATRDKPMTFELFCKLNPDIERLLKEWFTTAGDFDYVIGKIQHKKEKNGYYRTVIPIKNKGNLRSPDLEVLVKLDDGTDFIDTVGAYESDTRISILTKQKVKKVVLDPHQLIPDCDRTNNRNFKSLKLDLFPAHNSIDSLDSYRMFLYPVPTIFPGYSSEQGFSLGTIVLQSMGLERRFGCAGSIKDNNFLAKAGYNFKASEWMWDVCFKKLINTPATLCYFATDYIYNPEYITVSGSLTFKKAPNRNRPPLNTLSIHPRFTRLRRPEYRTRADWAEGNIVALEISYSRKNMVSFSRKVKGYRFYASGSKAFRNLGSDWGFEKLTLTTELYNPLNVNMVFANRIYFGLTHGKAPLQELYDLVCNGLFFDLPMYDYSAKNIFSITSELRLHKVIPFFDAAVFSRNAWLMEAHLNGYNCYNEMGISLRLFNALMFDITLWDKTPDPGRTDNHNFRYSLVVGSPLRYSSTRWFR